MSEPKHIWLARYQSDVYTERVMSGDERWTKTDGPVWDALMEWAKLAAQGDRMLRGGAAHDVLRDLLAYFESDK